MGIFQRQEVDTNHARTSPSDYSFILEINKNPGGTSTLGQFGELSEKVKNSICKIAIGDGFGTGFLTKIPHPTEEDRELKVLISCNHVLNKEQLEKFNCLSIGIKHININLPLDNRKIWANSDFNYD